MYQSSTKAQRKALDKIGNIIRHQIFPLLLQNKLDESIIDCLVKNHQNRNENFVLKTTFNLQLQSQTDFVKTTELSRDIAESLNSTRQ